MQGLKATFLHQPADTHPRYWNELWQQNITPWDRDGPSLALRDAVTSSDAILQSPIRDATAAASPTATTAAAAAAKQRKRALVPGCGRGYDVLLLAALGYDAYGLDVSEAALAAARALLQRHNSAIDGQYAPHDAERGRGKAVFVHGNFFDDDFLAQTSGGKFDLIFDYTFLCALPPERRAWWAQRQSELLAPTGHLICLEWPLGKDPREGGPPHGLTSELYVQLLRRPGEEVKYDSDGTVVADSSAGESERALVRLAHWRAKRTHEAGKDTDYVSIWKHSTA